LIALAFDPGITTGYAVGTIEDGSMAVRADQEKWRHQDLYYQLTLSAPDWVIWEKFVFRKKQQHEGVELYPRELIGVLKLYIVLTNDKAGYERVKPWEQMPMKSAGAYFTDRKISDDGLWIPGKPHAMDALRHLLHWFHFGPGYQYNTKGYHAA
jgi:hypothetical protein